jgi:hypothetical protein
MAHAALLPYVAGWALPPCDPLPPVSAAVRQQCAAGCFLAMLGTYAVATHRAVSPSRCDIQGGRSGVPLHPCRLRLRAVLRTRGSSARVPATPGRVPPPPPWVRARCGALEYATLAGLQLYQRLVLSVLALLVRPPALALSVVRQSPARPMVLAAFDRACVALGCTPCSATHARARTRRRLLYRCRQARPTPSLQC